MNFPARSWNGGVFRLLRPFISVMLCVAAASPGWAATVEYSLTFENASVSLTGRPASAMTIYGSIPGPDLRFYEGDTARIHVRNAMDVETSIHWHGVRNYF